MLRDLIGAVRGGLCGVMGNRFIYSQSNNKSNSNSESNNNNNRTSNSNSNSNRSIWYIDANNLYGYALMQKLPSKDYEYINTSLDEVLNTSDDRDYGYWLICDLEYTNECKDKIANFQLLPHRREVEKNELGYKRRPVFSSKSKKLIIDQNNKYECPKHYRMLKSLLRWV